MKIITKKIDRALRANGESDLEAILDDGNTKDHKPVVKLFTPDASATWLLTSYEMDGDSKPTGRAFGLCDLGHGYVELGYVDLEELFSLRGWFGMKVERDLHFVGTHTLTEYADNIEREAQS